jgi:excisionase family DNA binding protein
MINDKKMLTVKELASYLCISESTVRKMVRESRIPFTKILSKILFNKSVIDNWLVNNQSGV